MISRISGKMLFTETKHGQGTNSFIIFGIDSLPWHMVVELRVDQDC